MTIEQVSGSKSLSEGRWTYDVNHFHDHIINQAKAEWLADFNFSFFMTLTYRKSVFSEKKVREDLKKLYRAVSQKAFGRNAYDAFPSENSISFYAVIEEHADGALHIHMMLEDISRKNAYVRDSFQHLPDLIFIEWRKLAGNPTQLDEKRVCDRKERLSFANYLLKKSGARAERDVMDYLHVKKSINK
ncbi:hypothetical protein [Halopseudomonas pelagia]|uniref:Replication-associated protein ORF2/G2P domain-containing protein n=1 Tax=Halopseudomonas pelagia TaxID=553151 RepID=A0AA91U147_9GAMM|nr:hypothetical protein [Halopseudomonas pelagia]PCC98481.1 hypothetical protein CO192_15605 [Halopseudomonas pelagia]QFY56125.1 hypothetical protein EAO82_06940 [Halopseudomonas pelagia]